MVSTLGTFPGLEFTPTPISLSIGPLPSPPHLLPVLQLMPLENLRTAGEDSEARPGTLHPPPHPRHPDTPSWAAVICCPLSAGWLPPARAPHTPALQPGELQEGALPPPPPPPQPGPGRPLCSAALLPTPPHPPWTVSGQRPPPCCNSPVSPSTPKVLVSAILFDLGEGFFLPHMGPLPLTATPGPPASAPTGPWPTAPAAQAPQAWPPGEQGVYSGER